MSADVHTSLEEEALLGGPGAPVGSQRGSNTFMRANPRSVAGRADLPKLKILLTHTAHNRLVLGSSFKLRPERRAWFS